jgi:hypothetical protein
MDWIVSATIQFVSLAASFLGIVAFFKLRSKARLVFPAIGIAAALGLAVLAFLFNENRIDVIRRTSLVNDAKILNSSISITGWENEGNYLGYLNQLSGFYSRHKDYYPIEAPRYEQYVSEWSEFFRQKRVAGSFVPSSDTSQLEGLVQAGKSNLESILRNNQK